jgi:heme exporter protein D
MQFSSFADFIAMDGHGFYVWISYGASALLFFLLIYISKSQDQQVKKQIVLREKRHKKLKVAEKNKQNRYNLEEKIEPLDQKLANIFPAKVVEKNNESTS